METGLISDIDNCISFFFYDISDGIADTELTEGKGKLMKTIEG